MASINSNIRLLINKPLDAVTNMAIDFAIFKYYLEGNSGATIRFYGWKIPALSLGKFQKTENIDVDNCKTKGLDIARRPTGGRAIIHLTDELTYSIVGGTRSGLPDGLEKSYLYVCNALIKGLKLMGIDAEIKKRRKNIENKVICYLSTSLSDIEVAGKKLVGSAQLRDGNNFLQHGSIPVSGSEKYIGWAFKFGSKKELEKKIELYNFKTTYLNKLVHAKIDRNNLMNNIIDGFKQSWQCEFEAGQLSEREIRLVELFKNIFSR